MGFGNPGGAPGGEELEKGAAALAVGREGNGALHSFLPLSPGLFGVPTAPGTGKEGKWNARLLHHVSVLAAAIRPLQGDLILKKPRGTWGRQGEWKASLHSILPLPATS